jgi:hypothetical protein
MPAYAVAASRGDRASREDILGVARPGSHRRLVSCFDLLGDGPGCISTRAVLSVLPQLELPFAMKTKTIALKPRNPLVAPALHRKAGTHRRSRSGLRHRLRMALQKELESDSRGA